MYIYYEANEANLKSVTFQKRQNYGDSKRISGGQALGVAGRNERAEHRRF